MVNSIEELKTFLKENDMEDSVFLDEPDYVSCIEGISTEGNIIYNYDKMVNYLIENKVCENYEEAVEFIDYNTLRAIPYMDEKKPIVLYINL